MKKKRKKAASLQELCASHLISLTEASFLLVPSLGSAPDVPSRFDNPKMYSCRQFALQLLGDQEEGYNSLSKVYLRTFFQHLTEKISIQWDTVQMDHQLFVRIPLEVSRNSFVALLDLAEDELGVTQVVVCLDRNNQNFRDLVKSFHFMGFEHIVQSQHHSIAIDREFSKKFHLLGMEVD